MNELSPYLLHRRVFSTPDIVQAHPPHLDHRNKKAVHRLACPPGSTPAGSIVVTRWRHRPLPETWKPSGTVEAREDVFQYESPTDWYLNFAHHDLFCAYGGRLFAQDEVQVAEHPALASVREALLRAPEAEARPLTVESGKPTPVLIAGVERRCVVSGLYGNHFAKASVEEVERATRVLVPPTLSNILAIEAPSAGVGRYTTDQIDFILLTAFSGFAAARDESAPRSTVVHTGFWGCGAYGGNRVLMALLQLMAASLAGVDRLVFHTFDAAGTKALASAGEILGRQRPGSLDGLVFQVAKLGFVWGESDGT